MEFDEYELAMIWFALLMDQETYEKGSKNWFRRERIIRQIEKHLGMTGLMETTPDRPVVTEIKS